MAGSPDAPAVISKMVKRLGLEEELVEPLTRLVEDGRQAPVWQALAELDTVQWARFQQEFAVQPVHIVALLAEVEKQATNNATGSWCSSSKRHTARGWSSPFGGLCAPLALGSWSLLCVLDVSGAWWPDADTTVEGRESSWIIVLAVLAASIFAFVVPAVRLQSGGVGGADQRRVHSFGESSPPKDTTKATIGNTLTGSFLVMHILLVVGAICWVLLHVAAGRTPQVCAGLAILYNVVSLLAVRSNPSSSQADSKVWPQESYGNCATKPDDKEDRPKESPKQKNKAKTCDLNPLSQYPQRNDRWSPMFKDALKALLEEAAEVDDIPEEEFSPRASKGTNSPPNRPAAGFQAKDEPWTLPDPDRKITETTEHPEMEVPRMVLSFPNGQASGKNSPPSSYPNLEQPRRPSIGSAFSDVSDGPAQVVPQIAPAAQDKDEDKDSDDESALSDVTDHGGANSANNVKVDPSSPIGKGFKAADQVSGSTEENAAESSTQPVVIEIDTKEHKPAKVSIASAESAFSDVSTS
eukprot:gnl/TRDRNA2_/TRDRNA2_156753_c0_seq1.p1 gnl/TRDRNA2_/TRDRNA2_156753_c0~~gnl/TRDRNA2_/TRDRNA2_156753_c0_seq1.p1  ORF type:complete len:524 (+),score=98.87 gnl/TRDRNA2_/TRDRNA2_156753_c0_seq1:126-1697(+)